VEAWQIVIGGIVAGAGGLGTGATIGAWLARREIRRIFDAVDRMPPEGWFQRVERKIDDLDPERIALHFDQVHAHHEAITRHEGSLAELRRDVDDHEQRLRTVEGRG
jgi:hypothetical protein